MVISGTQQDRQRRPDLPAWGLGKDPRRRPDQFVTTNWSLVLNARKDSDHAAKSLELLCAEYWFPLFAYLRQQGSSTHDAEDLLQSFFAWLLSADLVERADRERGRFRTFLLVALRQFCAREHRWSNALKRQPNTKTISLDAATAGARFDRSLVNDWTPERQFNHTWALTVLEVAMSRLRDEYANTGRLARFEKLAPFLTDENRPDRESSRQELAMSEAAFGMALGRMRRRFGILLYEEVARTVGESSDVEDEMKQILAAIAG
ncbi:MAG: hypothetical protein U1D30_16125 [Planctomycetota bacterium]